MADPSLVYGIVVVTIGSLFASGLAFSINVVHNNERKNQYLNEAEKIREILGKVRGSIVDDTQGSTKKQRKS